MDSNFWQYKLYMGIRSGSLETRYQTTVGWRVMRTCCARMLKFIRCVRKKLAGSSDVGFGGDRRNSRSLQR